MIQSGAMDFERLAALAQTACDAAAKEIMPRFRGVFDVDHKQDGSIVTTADRAAEGAIRGVLEAEFPVLGEEFGGESPSDGSPYWVVDPIDGTISFSRGIPLFATLIGLVVDGAPVLGVIDLPAIGDRLVGYRGAPALANGQPCRVSQATDPATAIVSHGDPETFELFGARSLFDKLTQECGRLRGYTDAFGHALVARGSIDLMVDTYLSPWDVAGPRAVIEAAGGHWLEFQDPSSGKLAVLAGSRPLVERYAGGLRSS